MKKKIISLALALLMVLSLLPVSAFAAETTETITSDRNIHDNYDQITKNGTNAKVGFYYETEGGWALYQGQPIIITALNDMRIKKISFYVVSFDQWTPNSSSVKYSTDIQGQNGEGLSCGQLHEITFEKPASEIKIEYGSGRCSNIASVTLTLVPAHEHSFTYSADKNVLKATCTSGCTDKYDTAPAALTLTAPASLGYTGSAISIDYGKDEASKWKTATGKDAPTVAYYLADGATQTNSENSGASDSGKAPVNPGSYVAKATVAGTDKTAVLAFEITKGTQTISGDASKTVTYGDTGKSISASVPTNGGALSYAIKEGEATDVVNVDAASGALEILKAGSTTVVVSAAETDYYNANSKEVPVTVNKLGIAKPTADTTTFTYTGEPQTYNPTDFDADTMEISGNVQTDANESGYTVTVTPKSDYTWEGECKFTWVISKANYTGFDTTASGSILARSGKTTDVALPAIPETASYGTPVVASADNGKLTGSITDNVLTLTMSRDLDAATEDNDMTVTVPVTPDKNHNGYDITVTVDPFFHVHDWDEAWQQTETHHWHKCLNTDTYCWLTDEASYAACGENEAAYGEHVYSENKLETAYFTCADCGYVDAARQMDYFRATAMEQLKVAAKSDDCKSMNNILAKAEKALAACKSEGEVDIVVSRYLKEIGNHLPQHAGFNVIFGGGSGLVGLVKSFIQKDFLETVSGLNLFSGIVKTVTNVIKSIF